MKRVLMMLVVGVFAVLPGCSYVFPQSNLAPQAYIDSITPSEVAVGDTVSFAGHGTDADGQVVGYRWRSDRDGQLSASSTFQTSALSAGNHTIYFMVQNNRDVWSAETSAVVRVLSDVPVPVTVISFTASLSSVAPGGRVTLSWNVSNATTVSIDNGVGIVPPAGSVVVTPSSTTTYKLSALGSGSTAAASVTVQVIQNARTVIIAANAENSGYIRSSGAGSTEFVYVGDDSSNRDFQGFITFDLTCIPNGATITRVTVDMSDYEVPYDAPFPQLGCLGAYVQDYGSLTNTDYWSGSLSTPIAEWCSLGELDTPASWSGFRSALQDRVGEARFQFRLQFADHITDNDDLNDLLRWPPDHLPTMTVEYHT
jgi:hypothetical protein